MKRLFLLIMLPLASLAQKASNVYHLWENGAPGFEHLKNEKEQAKDWWVKNVHHPSITAFFPAEGTGNGTAVLIFPGGGHRELVFNAEGKDAAEFFNQYGITAFVLKYRLARESDSPYQLGVHAKEDAQRAIRMIRAKATAWRLDVDKIGIMGFSAGGEVAHWMAYGNGMDVLNPIDETDKFNAKPNFQILIYPGPLGVPEIIDKTAPPTFLLTANDDPCCSEPTFQLLKAFRKGGVPVEAHFFSKGGHGFNMGKRSSLKTLSNWPDRLGDWLIDTGLGKQ